MKHLLSSLREFQATEERIDASCETSFSCFPMLTCLSDQDVFTWWWWCPSDKITNFSPLSFHLTAREETDKELIFVSLEDDSYLFSFWMQSLSSWFFPSTGSSQMESLQKKQTFLVLEDGTVFTGYSFGSSKTISGEVGELTVRC